MANRAYLYPSESKSFQNAPEQLYYDSRHTIPIGWFFFFRPTDIAMVEVRFQTKQYVEVKLTAAKAEAMKVFESRRELLRPYVAGVERAADEMVERLRRWRGEWLWMDPSEVVDFDDSLHRGKFERILASLETGAAREIDEALRVYCERLPEEPQQRELAVLGYTYAWEE